MPATTRLDRIALWLGPLAIIALIFWMAGWTGPGASAQWAGATWVLVTESIWPLLWLASAIGWGSLLRKAGQVRSSGAGGWGIQTGLGVALLLTLDTAIGALGWLQIGGHIGAWAITTIGLLLLALQITQERHSIEFKPPSLFIWCAAPAIAVLLLASTSAPGWLWATEFGGYDALSYHLQLPKEWLALGRIEPLEHNVYSFLPGYMEAAYYHLAVMTGDGIGSAYAAQLLHAGMTMLAAVAVGALAARVVGSRAGVIAGAITLGTPWVIVVGSLAYNEMTVVFLFAVALLVLVQDDVPALKRGAMVGLLAAAACGAKLTSFGFVVIPIGLVMMFALSGRALWIALAAAIVVGAIGLAPWLIRNGIAHGNPTFPFATSVFGTAHWTAEQVAIWHSGHGSDLPLVGRLGALWDEWLRQGFGPVPDPAEPWKPQWSVLPWLGVAGALTGLLRRATRRWSSITLLMLMAQIIFWLGFTHLQSRFLLPSVVPCALGVVLGLVALVPRVGLTMTLPGLIALAWCVQPMLTIRSERGGTPALSIGAVDTLTGDAMSLEDRREFGMSAMPAVYLNHLLPAGSRVLLIGNARPFFCRADVAYQTTWDRGPLSRAMNAAPNDPAAWIDALHTEGFTHVLVDPDMLDRWHSDGWGDPRLTGSTVLHALDGQGRALVRYAGGSALFELTPRYP